MAISRSRQAGELLVAIGPGVASAGGYVNAIVALDPTTLQPIDWFSTPTTEFVTTPMVINRAGRETVVAATREGRILLLDAGALGGANHSTPLFASAPLGSNTSPDALATFEQEGTVWLLCRSARQLLAFKIAEGGSGPTLQPGWTSRDIAAPTAPIVVNDVVFVAASGRPQGTATLYALDSRSGRELWSSAKTMTSHMPPGNLWASNSQVYAGTYDGTVYAFGFTLERR